MTLITAMTAESARSFFLKHKSYCSFALPAYFDFAPLLLAVKMLSNKSKTVLMISVTKKHAISIMLTIVTNGAIVIHTQRLKSDPGGNLLS